jgi:nitroreductase / dihydropteridine reductase
MYKVPPGPIVTLCDLYNEPVNRTIGCFNYYASSYGLEPFKLVTFNNSIMISRFKLAGIPLSPGKDHHFLSVLLVKTSIGLDEVNEFVIDLASSRRLSHAVLNIYKNVLQDSNKSECTSGKDWAFNQARLSLRLLLSMAKETGIDIRTIEKFDRNLFNEVLGLTENKWSVFSVFLLRANIRITPDSLMHSTFCLN